VGDCRLARHDGAARAGLDIIGILRAQPAKQDLSRWSNQSCQAVLVRGWPGRRRSAPNVRALDYDESGEQCSLCPSGNPGSGPSDRGERLGKASREQRRADRKRGVEWVATDAARDAQRRRRHSIDHIPGHPILRLEAELKFRQLVEDMAIALEQGGSRPEAAQHYSPLAVLGGMGVEPPYDDVSRIARDLLDEDADTLDTGELFVVSPSMQRVTVAAAQTLTALDVATLRAEDDMPALVGVLVLSEPLVVRGRDGSLSDLRAFVWKPSRTFLGAPAEWAPGVRITDFMDADGPVHAEAFQSVLSASRAQGRPLPLLVPDQRFGLRTDGFARGADDEWRATELQIHRDRSARLAEIGKDGVGARHHAHATVSVSYEGGVIQDDDHDFTPRFLFAFWRLCQQRIPAITRYSDEPGTAGVSARMADTRIVQLRGWDPTRSDPKRQARGRQYTHRWVVRMHKVRQWYPSEGVHKIIWRGPYIKGPDGAVLLDGDMVHALVR